MREILHGRRAVPSIIVGLGNPILSDDGVGWRVVHAVRARMQSEGANGAVEIREACVGGLSLAELLIGYRRAVVVDAIMTDGGVPGTVYHLKLTDLPGTLNSASAHDTNIITALRALRRFGAKLPFDRDIDVIAVEAQDVWTFSEQCTPAVEAGIPQAVSVVMRLFEEEYQADG